MHIHYIIFAIATAPLLATVRKKVFDKTRVVNPSLVSQCLLIKIISS